MKRIILIIAIALLIFQMVVLATEIDIGNTAIDRIYNTTPDYTYIDRANPANANGTITSIEIYTVFAMSGVSVGIFYEGASQYFSTRSYVDIGDVPQGYSQYDVNLEVMEGDYIGIYGATGNMYRGNTGVGWWAKNGDHVPCTNAWFTESDDKTLSLYGTGTTEEEANAIFFGTNF